MTNPSPVLPKPRAPGRTGSPATAALRSARLLRFRRAVRSCRKILFLWVTAGAGSLTAAAAQAEVLLPKVPAGWKFEIVAQAPAIRHPSVVCVAPDGRVFVAEDPMDISLPKADAALGRILCLHPDGRITVFAEKLFAVFGMQYLEGKLYVLHNPKFSVFKDDDSVGKDRVDLIESTNPNPSALNWNDHIPANFRLAMDGYFYVAVGDKGIYGAVGRDGRRVDLHGGGILRLRPDGTALEVYCTGVRNILDVALNAEDEIFTYDNTDEQAWMSRVTHMVDGGFYGYPYDFIPRQPYTLWKFADYGGGAATGAECYTEDALPPEFHDNLFLADWGRRELTRARIAREGGSYREVSHEQMLEAVPNDFRPVGIAVSSDGLAFYICDWNHKDTKEEVEVGRLAKLSYTGKSWAAPKPSWYLAAALGKKVEISAGELVSGLSHPARSVRLIAQRRLVEAAQEANQSSANAGSRRAGSLSTRLARLLADHHAPAHARWHALWTLDAIDGGVAARREIRAALRDSDPSVRRQAIRQLGMRRVKEATSELAALLKDPDASVRFQAATALGRVGETRAVPQLLAALAENDLFARYAVFTALNRIGRSDPAAWPKIAAGLDDANATAREGAIFALRETYELPLAQTLARLARAPDRSSAARRAALELLAHLHRQRPAWQGEWWAYHPVNAPPPAKSVDWAGTALVIESLNAALDYGDPLLVGAAIEGVREAGYTAAAPKLRALFARTSHPELKRSILATLGSFKDADATSLLASVLTPATTGTDSPPALVNDALAAAEQIGTTESAALLVRFLASHPARRDDLLRTIQAVARLKAAGSLAPLVSLARAGDAEVRREALSALAGLGGDEALAAVLPFLDDASPEIRRAAVVAAGSFQRKSTVPKLLDAWRDPETRTEALFALARMRDLQALEPYLEALASRNAALRAAGRKALSDLQAEALPLIEAKADQLGPEALAELQKLYDKNDLARKGKLFAKAVARPALPEYLEFAVRNSGDAARGKKLFHDPAGVACVRCHKVGADGVDVGPDLSSIGTQLDRRNLAESILYPSRSVREGYQQVQVETRDGESYSGLVKAESNELLTLRDAGGKNQNIRKTEIKSRTNSELSLMPEGLEAALSLAEFSDLIEYLTTLKSGTRTSERQPATNLNEGAQLRP